MTERTVSWKALADFSRARREADLTAASFANLRREEERLNAASAAASTPKFDTQGLTRYAQAARDASSNTNDLVTAQRQQVLAMRDVERQSSSTSRAAEGVASSVGKIESVSGGASRGLRDVSNQARDAQGRFVAMASAARQAGRDTDTAEKMAGRAAATYSNLARAVGNATHEWDHHNQSQRRAQAALGGTLAMVGKVAAIVPLAGSAIDVLAAGVTDLAGAAVGLAGALGPAVGILATIPGLVTAGAGAVGTLVAGFGGIGGALKAYQAQQKSRASSTAANQATTLQNTAAEDARQNAQQIRTAQQSVAKARLDAARQAVDDANAIKQAQQGVRDAEVQGAQQIIQARQEQAATEQQAAKDIIAAQGQLQQAQQADLLAEQQLTEARRQAAQSIVDLRKQLQGQQLDEKGASLSLEEAQKNLSQVMNNPASTDLQRREAQYQVEQAKFALQNAKDSTKQISQQYQQASKAGVNGSAQVIAAKQNEAQADKGVKDAEANLAATRLDAANRIAAAQANVAQTQQSVARSVQQAQQQLSQAQLKQSRDIADSATTIKDAEADLANTLKEVQLRNQRLAIQQAEVARSTGAGTAATQAYTAALGELTPEAQAVVKQLISMQKRVQTIQKTAQRGMMPGFLDFLKAVDKLFPEVNGFVKDASKQFGDFFGKVAKQISSGGFLSDFNKIIDSSETLLGYFLDAADNTGKVLGRIMLAAIPLTEWLGQMADNWTKNWDNMTAGESGRKRLSDFFDKTKNVLELLGGIISGVGGALYNVFSAAAPAGEQLLESLDATAQHWKDWTDSLKGRNAIADWAQGGVKTTQELGKLFDDLFLAIGQIGKNVDFANFVKQVRTQLLPDLVTFLQDLQPGAALSGFVDLLDNLINLFDSIVKKLGGAGNVIDLLNQIVGIFQAIIDATPAPVLKAVVGAMVIGKVAGFVGQLTGLNTAFKLLSGKNSALRQAVDLFKHFGDNADRAARSAKHAGDIVEGSGAVGKRAAGTAGSAAEGAAGAAGGGLLSKAGGFLKGGAGRIGGLFAGGATAGEVLAVGEGTGAAVDATGVGLPVGLIIGIAAAVAAAVILIIKYWKQIKSALSAGWSWVKTESTKFGHWISAAWSKIWEPISTGAKAVWDGLKAIIGPPLRWVMSFVSYFAKYTAAVFKVAWQVITTLTKIAWNLFVLLVIRPIQGLWKAIQPILSRLGKAIKNAFLVMVGLLKAAWHVVSHVIAAPFVAAWKLVSAAWTRISNWVQDKMSALGNWIQRLWSGPIQDHIVKPIKQALTPVVHWMGQIFDSITGKLQDALDWIGRHLAVVGRILAKPFQDAWKGLKPVLDTIWGGVKTAMQHIHDWMEKLGGWASAAFSAFSKAVSDPIGFVVNKIINPGIINPYNKLADTFHLDHVGKIEWNKPAYKPPGRAGGGEIPGTRSPNRDNVLAVDENGTPVARVEPGEYVLPRWMAPIFPAMDQMRRTRRLYADGGQVPDSSYIQMLKKRKRGSDGWGSLLPGYKGGGLLTAIQGATGIGLTRPINAPISNGIHDVGAMGPNSSAVDASASVGHPVVAGASGKVTRSYDIKGYESRKVGPQDGYRSYGRVIEVDHGRFKTLYAHLSERQAKVGDILKTGQQLGLSGNTGNTTGPHLHFGAQDINPNDFWKSGFGRIIDAVRGAIGGAVGAITDPLGTLKAVWNKLKGGIAKGVGDSPWGKLIGKVPGTIFNGILSWAKGIVGLDDSGKAPAGSGVARWSGTVRTALGMLHLPTDNSYVQAWLRQIKTESGGNAKAVQQVNDINMINGNRAEGLVQVTPTTFQAYKVRGHGNIFNALDNLLAGMNWAKHAYGVKNMLNVIGHGHGYARGTSGASPGWRLVGENGPELMKFKGGEKVVPNHQLPGYDTGGVVRGFRPGANATWVRALRSQLMLGDSRHWGSDLTRALKNRDGIVRAVTDSTFHAANGKLAASRVLSMIRHNLSADGKHGRRGSHFGTWEWIANKVNYDPSRLWRYWNWIWPAVAHAKGIGSPVKNAIANARAGFVHERTNWVKALGRELGMKDIASHGTWSPDIQAPLRHIIAHGFGWKVGTHGHQEWSPRPWKAWTAAELNKQAAEQALSELNRSNQLNAEWDKILNQLTTWGLSYAVRKLTDTGTADGMTTARGLFKNKALAVKYNASAKAEYDRTDAQDSSNLGTASRDSQIVALLNALRSGDAGMGLTGLASKVSLSVDTVADLVKYINTNRKWADIPTTKRTRLLREANQFSNLFTFAQPAFLADGGEVPGYGNGDSKPAMLTPGELVVRKMAMAALRRDFGPGVAGMLNNYDRLANGGFAATSMKGMSMPAMAAMRGAVRGDIVTTKNVTYEFNSKVYNPIAEPAGLSVQKRVTSIARLGILGRDDEGKPVMP